jgi:pilus assembly protein Flp/PilA
VEKVMSKIIQRILVEDRAASMVEYALLVVLIAIVALAAVSLAGDEVSSMFSEIADDLATT